MVFQPRRNGFPICRAPPARRSEVVCGRGLVTVCARSGGRPVTSVRVRSRYSEELTTEDGDHVSSIDCEICHVFLVEDSEERPDLSRLGA